MTSKNRYGGIDVAIATIRPNAKYILSNKEFIEWDDPRPIPTWEEIEEVQKKLIDFENGVNILWLDDYK